MNMQEILDKIKACDTIPKLDALRPEIVKFIKKEGSGVETQKAFIVQFNKLRRIPIKDKTW